MAQLVKNISACNAGYLGLIPGLGKSPGDGKGYPHQYSGLENSMEYIVHGHKELDTTEQLPLLCTVLFLLEPTKPGTISESKKLYWAPNQFGVAQEWIRLSKETLQPHFLLKKVPDRCLESQ